MRDEPPLPSFDGHSNCLIESGRYKALLIDFNYDMEPLEGTFLLPSHMSFVGKDLETAPQIRHATRVKVGEIMQREVVTVRQGSALSDAARLMTEQHISGLPVTDVEDKVIGILTETDFLSALDVQGRRHSGPVRDHYSQAPQPQTDGHYRR